MELVLLFCGCLVYFFSFFQRVAVPGTVFDELQSEFSASAGAIALLGAIYLYLYGGMQLFAGVLSDRFGPLRVLLSGGALLSLGSILFPLAPGLPLLYVARAVVALGASLIYLSLVKSIDALFGAAHFAPLLGVCIFLGYSGGLVGTFPFERAVSAAGWRRALLGAGLLCLAATAAAGALFGRSGRMRHARGAFHAPALAAVVTNRLSLPNLLSGPLAFGVYFLIQATIGKKLLSDYCGLSSAHSAAFTFAMMLVGMLAAFAGGFVVRLTGNRRKPIVLAALGLGLAAVALLLVAVRGNLGAWYFLTAYLLMAAGQIATPAGVALMKELNPPGLVGTAIGTLNAASYLTVAVVTTAAGAIMDRYESAATRTEAAVVYPREAYLSILGLCLALSALAFLLAAAFMRETRGRALWKPPASVQPAGDLP